MGRCIVKVSDNDRDYYMEWSSIVDAPVTYGMSLDELRAHVKEQYGMEGLRELPMRLARVEEYGSSSQYRHSAVDEMWFNRAGKEETRLTYRQIVAVYCRREGDITGYRPTGNDDEDNEKWSPKIFDDRAVRSRTP